MTTGRILLADDDDSFRCTTAELLRREGYEFTSIRIRVQVDAGEEDTSKRFKKQMDSESLRPMADFARDLPAGPLKASLTRFLRRVG